MVEPTAPKEEEHVELQAVAHMVRFSGGHADEPPAPPKANEDANRTLECKHCGAKNGPTEWYCEKCGAELSTL